MLCYSGNGILNIKAGTFPAHQQKMQGFVVGFKGSKIFCLHVYAMTTVDVPQSASLDRYLERKEFEMGYNVACLGVTEGDWKRLAGEALEGLNLGVAQRAFARLRDLRYIDLIEMIEKLKGEGRSEADLFMGYIMAYNGKFHEAAKLFKRANQQQRAIEMYTELNMWEYATQLADETNSDRSLILKRKAQIQHDRNDLIAAASTYIEVGDFLQAINILGPAGTPAALDKLIELARMRLTKSDTKALSRCVHFFRRHGHNAYAAECLVKLGDIAHLLALHVELQQWEEAFRIADMHPKFAPQLYLPYANWLAMNDRYMEAQTNYRKAGRLDESIRVLEQLAKNAVAEHRYEDAAHLYWMLSLEKLESLPENADIAQLTDVQRRTLRHFHNFESLSEVYFAYHSIKRFIDDPFTSHLPESLLNMARFILHHTGTGGATSRQREPAEGVSRAYVLYALTKLSKTLGCYKLARYGHERLQTLQLPAEWRAGVDVGTLTIRGKPSADREDLLPVCFACSTANPMLNGVAGYGGGGGGAAAAAAEEAAVVVGGDR
ncbi:hypothetical protein HK101_005920, partial [Irineochytrium annulatum]